MSRRYLCRVSHLFHTGLLRWLRMSDLHPTRRRNDMRTRLTKGAAALVAIAALADENVVLDPDPSEIQHPLGPLPVDGVAVPLAELRVVQERRHEVDARLDRDDVAG